MPRPTRRDLVRALAALPALPACRTEAPPVDTGAPISEDPRAPEPTLPWPGVGTPDLATFPLGVQSGDPLPTGVRLWTRTVGAAPLTLHWATWDGAAWSEGPPLAAATVDGYAHVDLDAVADDTPIAFQFLDDAGAASPIGRCRTAVSPTHTGRVRFGATSCADQDHGEFPALEAVAAFAPMDFFFWLGDTVYCDGDSTTEDFRATWAENLSKPTMQTLNHATSGVYTWDDHEVTNNWDPQTIDPAVRDTAFAAFYETTPIRPDVPGRLWRRLRFGAAVEVFVLDCRSERDAAAGIYLSREQLDWLKAGLSSSDATWKVIANSVPIADFPAAWDIADSRSDRWEGYEAQRAELLDHITDSGLTGVLFVSGDLHQTCVYRVEETGPRSAIFDVMAGPAGSFLNVAAKLLEEGGQFVYSDAVWSATWFECSVDGTCRVVMLDETATVFLDLTLDIQGNVVRTDAAIHP